MRLFRKQQQSILENLIYVIIWMVVFAVPLIRDGYDNSIDNDVVLRTWEMLLPFFVLFLLNNYLLVPQLLFQKRFIPYLIASLLAICVLFGEDKHFNGDRPGLRPDKFRLDPRRDDFDDLLFGLPEDIDPDMRFPNERRSDGFRPPFLFWDNRWMAVILLLGFNAAIKLLFKSMQDEQQMKELERHTLQTELENLKHQINPHFFMNTLNNIHALMDIDTEKAKETVIELSKLMRYVLYDANSPRVLLGKEIQFLENYIALMRLRYTNDIDIQADLPAIVPEIMVPPLLFISCIENAFKHGISYLHPSFVHLKLEDDEKEVRCVIENSMNRKRDDSHHGVGLENTRKRLNLIYGDNYTFNITEQDNCFRVIIIIPADL